MLPAPDAIRLDSTGLSLKEVVDRMEAEVRRRKRRWTMNQSPEAFHHSRIHHSRFLMPVPGWPDWLSHAWYRVNFGVQMVGMTLAFSLRHEGMENVPLTGPVLLVSNHQSYLDPTLVGVASYRDIYYLARKTLFKNPLLALYISSMNGIPVDSTGVAKEGLKAVIDLLHAGQAVVVYPEGERTRTGKVQPMKPGVQLVLKRAPCRWFRSASPGPTSRSRARAGSRSCRRSSCRRRAAPWRCRSASRSTRNPC